MQDRLILILPTVIPILENTLRSTMMGFGVQIQVQIQVQVQILMGLIFILYAV